MHSETKKSSQRRVKRSIRIRKTLKGNAQKPRLTVHKSNCHIYVQVIDDENGRTLAGLGTYNKELRSASAGKTKSERAAIVGAKIAAKIKDELKIEALVFDRGPNKYHGVIAALADAVREAGIKV